MGTVNNSPGSFVALSGGEDDTQLAKRKSRNTLGWLQVTVVLAVNIAAASSSCMSPLLPPLQNALLEQNGVGAGTAPPVRRKGRSSEYSRPRYFLVRTSQ